MKIAEAAISRARNVYSKQSNITRRLMYIITCSLHNFLHRTVLTIIPIDYLYQPYLLFVIKILVNYIYIIDIDNKIFWKH